MNELYHHGIKGQKWGVKNGPPYPLSDDAHSDGEKSKKWWNSLSKETNNRIKKEYFNSDGSLTQKGKDVVEKIKNGRKEAYKDKSFASQVTPEYKALQRYGVYSEDKNTDVIPKGAKFYRTTGVQETVDDRKKYVSLTDGDKSTYQDSWDKLGIDTNRRFLETYEATKDIKVATGENVMTYVLDNYGDKKLKDYIGVGKYPNNYADKNSYGEQLVAKMANEGRVRMAWVMNETVFKSTKTSSEVFDHFAKLGYDAIVDAEDYYGWGEVQYPLILLNPKNSVNKTDSKET